MKPVNLRHKYDEAMRHLATLLVSGEFAYYLENDPSINVSIGAFKELEEARDFIQLCFDSKHL